MGCRSIKISFQFAVTGSRAQSRKNESKMQKKLWLFVAVALCWARVAVAQDKACDGLGELRASLQTNRDDLADTLKTCVAPLLFAPIKWLTPSQAHGYCSQEACAHAVALLTQLPTCTWESPATGSDSDLIAEPSLNGNRPAERARGDDDDRRRSSHRSSRGRSRSRSPHASSSSRSREHRSSRHRSSHDKERTRSRSRDRERRRSGDRSERRSSRHRSRSRSRSSSRPVRRRKKSNFDVRPPGVTEENAAAYAAQAILQQNMAALSGAVGPASFGPPQQQAPAMPSGQTRHARRLYVGGIGEITEPEITAFFNDVIDRALGEKQEGGAVVSVYINRERHFAFVELRTIELTTACMNLDGVAYRGQPLKIRRPNDYNPATVPKDLGPIP
ncbi:hypothetical protein BBJ28_00007972, partial [Nothophytophthora sp. Chile5]